MSTELSASETTPLRRPESSLSDYLNIQSLDVSQRNSGQSTVAVASNNNNNHIEVRLGNTLVTPTTTATTTINTATTSGIYSQNMDTNKRILCRVGLDVLILLCVGFPILGFYLWGNSYKRGFFCDDESLMHPFHDSTVKNWMLYIIGGAIPIGVMFAVEFIKSQQLANRTNGNNTRRPYIFMDYEIPDWLIECYKKIGVFGFGAAIGQLTTDIAKYSIGRLRPHFFAVCQPADVHTNIPICDDPNNFNKYITEFKCLGVNSTPTMIKESRLSFPSGHSSFSFYTMVYVALYLQSRMTWRGSKLFRHFLQFLCIMIAWYTALSRVSDYKHHWSDVLAGSAIGALTAVVVAKYVSDLFVEKSGKQYMLPHTMQDMPVHTSTTNGH